jgi:hypothetical protein
MLQSGADSKLSPAIGFIVFFQCEKIQVVASEDLDENQFYLI